ncbi:MAG: tetratricopeptide repeat protein [Planctomycetales bacterium]|nr:tetratricopeptide repeat protein [Planctomycetales bacterium]
MVLRNCFTAFLASLLMCACATAQDAPQPFTAETLLSPVIDSYSPKYDDVQAALDSLRSGNVEQARQSLDAAYSKNPDLPPPNTMLAQIMFQARKPDAGKQALNEATRTNPDDPGAFIYLGDLSLQERQLGVAESMYTKGVELCNKYSANTKRRSRLLAKGYGGLALLKESSKDWAGAQDLLEKVIQNDPDNAVAMTRLGRVVFLGAKNEEDEKKAYKIFTDVYQLDPEHTARHEINMALLYEQGGRSARAESLMNLAIKRDGKNAKTRLAVTKWAIDAGKLDMASENVQAADAIEPDSLEVLVYKGLIDRFKGNYAAGEAAFREAHFRSPKHLGAMTQLALCLTSQDDDQKKQLGLQFADLCVRVYPDLKQSSGRESAVVLAWCLAQVGQSNAAAQAVARVVREGSISADSAYYAAQIIFDAGQSTAAERILESALKNERAFPNRSKAEQLMNRIKQG